MPLFFLGSDYCNAIKLTDIQEEIKWRELPLPYDQGILVLPPKAITSSVYGDCLFIIWAREYSGREYPGPMPNMTTAELAADGFSLITYFPNNGKPIWYDSHLTGTHRPTIKLHDLFYKEKYGEAPILERRGLNGPLDVLYDETVVYEDDESIIETIGVITFGTMLALGARPDLLTREIRESRVKDKHNPGKQVEYWAPNYIGRHYQYKRSSDQPTGTHASPRMHWRRGHMREQACGAGRKEHKTIWIEPCLIAAPIPQEPKK